MAVHPENRTSPNHRSIRKFPPEDQLRSSNFKMAAPAMVFPGSENSPHPSNRW